MKDTSHALVQGFSPEECAAIEAAVFERRSVRAFLNTPVPRATVERLLTLAARAPSGSNMQPWRAHVLAGAAKQALTDAILKGSPQKSDGAAYKYYPEPFFEPYLGRRRKVGLDLYSLIGVQKGDGAAMAAQMAKNYDFFGAPVGFIFTIDRRLEIGSWLDYGYFLQALSIAARAVGLETCSQAAFAFVHDPIRRALGLTETEMVVCGMALGYADWSAPVNALVTAREPAAAFAAFEGF